MILKIAVHRIVIIRKYAFLINIHHFPLEVPGHVLRQTAQEEGTIVASRGDGAYPGAVAANDITAGTGAREVTVAMSKDSAVISDSSCGGEGEKVNQQTYTKENTGLCQRRSAPPQIYKSMHEFLMQ